MVSFLDLGAIASARLSGSSAVTDADPSLLQVLSPGVFLRTGLKWTGPLVLGAGASFSPGLRIDEDGNNRTIFRFLAFAAVDVTILPF